MKKWRVLLTLAIGCLAFGLGCALPTPAPYPDADPTTLNTQAQQWSDNFQAYINDWFAGRVPKEIPSSLLPNGIQPGWKKNFYLMTEAEVTPESVWIVRPNEDVINFNALRNLYPDPHQAYLVEGCSLAPFGTKVLIEGDFPRCRFFSIQATQSFNPDQYVFANGFGSGETAIVDVDIEPDSGSINPFRVGANRAATNRHYKVTLELAKGKPNITNPNLAPPYHRAPGNTRKVGFLQYMGSYWMNNDIYGMRAPGKWSEGALWVRHQRIDKGLDAKAGVALPKLIYQNIDGRKYYVNCDYSGFKAWGIDQRFTANTTNADATSDQLSFGMRKQFGIFLCIAENAKRSLGKDSAYVRDLDRGATGRGEEMAAPGNWEAAASCGNHYNYLVKDINIYSGKCVAITGKLPTYPKTRNGETTMTGAEMRYLSFSSYEINMSDMMRTSICLTSVCDDEIVINANREYVLCYSRAADKPANATSAAGVTWINSGPTSEHAWTTRWCTVNPDWIWAKAPNELNLPWKKAGYCATQYDPNLLGKNGHTGFMGMYQPMYHSMSKSTFQGLGTPVTLAKVEAASDCGSSLGTGASSGFMVVLPLMIAALVNVIWFRRRRS